MLDAPWAPFSVDFNLANVGGPSAGLMFSLAVSTSSPPATWPTRSSSRAPERSSRDGKVGKIGGITHKMGAAQEAGATVFLVPAGNCYEANSEKVPGLQLIKVDTLGQAVDALHAVAAGGERRRVAEPVRSSRGGSPVCVE